MSFDYHSPCPKCGVKVDPWVHDCPIYGTPEHHPVIHRGRLVCTCGDFNCASLDGITATEVAE